MTHTHFLYILQINKDPLYRFDTNSCSIQFSLTIQTMDDLLHISPEFNWNIENPTQNEFIYSASSIGLNSSVLFQHFLQLAIRSRKKG